VRYILKRKLHGQLIVLIFSSWTRIRSNFSEKKQKGAANEAEISFKRLCSIVDTSTIYVFHVARTVLQLQRLSSLKSSTQIAKKKLLNVYKGKYYLCGTASY